MGSNTVSSGTTATLRRPVADLRDAVRPRAVIDVFVAPALTGVTRGYSKWPNCVRRCAFAAACETIPAYLSSPPSLNRVSS
jgi:hypothetical protein